MAKPTVRWNNLRNNERARKLMHGIGQRLRIARCLRGLSTKETGAATEFAPETISCYENGIWAPNIVYIAAFMKYAKIAPNYIFGMDGWNPADFVDSRIDEENKIAGKTEEQADAI